MSLGWMASALLAAGLAPAPTACEPEAFRVALDVGHTEESPGAISARGVPERAFNAALAAHVAAALHEAGFTSQHVIAGDEVPIELAERAERANQWGADVFISLHHDSVQERYLEPWTFEGRELDYSDHARGYSLFISKENPRSEASLVLATALGKALREAGLRPSGHHAEPIEGENRPFIDEDLGIHRFDGLAVLRAADMPAVLLEAGVIKHPEEELAVGTDAYRRRVADAVVSAVHRLCSLPVPQPAGSDASGREP